MVSEVGRAGRYTLHGCIGSGGLATVHLGHADGAMGFRRVVAIKRLRGELASDPEIRAMLIDEGRLLARIQHRAVVSVLDVVVAGPDLWLVTEYVHGESFARLLDGCVERGAPPSAALAVTIVVEALHGLEAAHRARSERGEPLGLVHRDVSPQNILLGEDGSVKVADFGVARAAGRLQVTREGQLKGKLAYMAPEQIRCGEVDARADVFSAAVILWEALTLRRLFGGASDLATVDRVAAGPIDRPSRVEPRVPAVLDDIVLKGLAKRPEDRWSSAQAFADALEAAIERPKREAIGAWVRELAGASLEERSRIRVAMADATTETAPVRLSGAPLRRSPRWRRAHIPLLAIAGGVVALAALAVTRGRRSGVEAPEGSAPVGLPESTSAARPEARATAATSPPVEAAPSAARAPGPARPRPRAAAPAQPPAPACDPPYVIDDRGIVRPKRECL